jgi:cellulose biosynthesis protein BcsQ
MSESEFPNLWVSYAPTPSFSQEILSADVKTHGRYLKKILEGMRTAHQQLGFDAVIIDNSSGISLQSINYLTCSDKSLLIIRPVRYGVETTYELIQAIYSRLKYADPKSVRRDFLVWNQVPIQDNAPLEPRIGKYMDYWKQKFSEAGIEYGSRIPYMFDVVSSMIVDNPLDLPKLSGFIQEPLDELIRLLG